jgi:hypothetical protein
MVAVRDQVSYEFARNMISLFFPREFLKEQHGNADQ